MHRVIYTLKKYDIELFALRKIDFRNFRTLAVDARIAVTSME